MRQSRVWVGVLGVVVLLAGCGEQSGTEGGKKKAVADYSSPKATFETVRRAAEDSDLEAFLACLTEESQTRLKRVSELGKDLGKVTPADGMKLTAEDVMKAIASGDSVLGEAAIDGDKATAKVVSKDAAASDDVVTFARDGDDWKIVLPITDEDIQALEEQVEDALARFTSASDAVEEK